jgi:outer membrane lipoprotein
MMEKTMRKLFFIIFSMLILSSCAPVLRQDIMETGIKEFSLSDMRSNPDIYQGKLFILGGSIVNTKLTQEGSQVEALYIPVDSRGYLKDVEPLSSDGRFLAILHKEQGTLDPLIYRKGRDITLAGEFSETRSGKIDEMEYIYPVFNIKEIYLWKEREYYPGYYYPGYYYPYPYAYPYGWYDPWWRPWGPWWRPHHPYWW